MPAKKKTSKVSDSKKESLKKKVTKKTSTKKKIVKTNKIVDAPQDQYFILCNGKPLKNIKELAEILEDLEDWVFNYHVTPDKNDFATWLTHVFNELDLAKELAGVKEKEKMRLVLYKHIIKEIH